MCIVCSLGYRGKFSVFVFIKKVICYDLKALLVMRGVSAATLITTGDHVLAFFLSIIFVTPQLVMCVSVSVFSI